MGTMILIIAFIVEAAFATYCIVTRSDQKKVRSLLRVGAFASFILLILVSVIQWGFRWYLLAVLLLIWAVPGARTLISKKTESQGYTVPRKVINAIGTLLLVFIATTPALIFPQFTLPEATGTHEVATVNYTYTDDSRVETFANTGEHRKVNVEFWYPADGGGPYPLIVFSHGAFGMKISNTSTFMELASNGYVICSIDHPYHSLFTADADGKTTMVDQAFLQEVVDINNDKYEEDAIFKLEQKWMNLRTADINFVLDTILANVNDSGSDAVYRLIDPGKIGLIGHSLGGAASAQVARERSDVSAVVNLDANLFGEHLDYVDGKYVMNDTVYPVPILTIYSDDMVRLMDAIDDPNDVIAVKHVSATAPIAFEIHLTGTNHMSLTDLPLVSPFLVSMIQNSVGIVGGQTAEPYATIEKMNDFVLMFFNAYLKDKGNFAAAGSN